MIRSLKVVQSLVIVVMLTFAFTSGIFVLGTTQSWWKADVVLSGSMEPTMPVGSLVFATEKPTADLTVGDVLLFHAPVDGRPKMMHRIVAIGHDRDGLLTVQTKGDHNTERDAWTASVPTPTSLVVAHHVPYLGYLMHNPLSVAAVIAGLILLLTALGFLQSALETDDKDQEPAEQGTHHP